MLHVLFFFSRHFLSFSYFSRFLTGIFNVPNQNKSSKFSEAIQFLRLDITICRIVQPFSTGEVLATVHSIAWTSKDVFWYSKTWFDKNFWKTFSWAVCLFSNLPALISVSHNLPNAETMLEMIKTITDY